MLWRASKGSANARPLRASSSLLASAFLFGCVTSLGLLSLLRPLFTSAAAAAVLRAQGHQYLGRPNFHDPRYLQDQGLDAGSDVDGQKQRVLYVVRTCPKYYETRLKDALSTYLAEVPAERILPVGNNASVVEAPDHTRGLHSLEMRSIAVSPTDGDGLDQPPPCADNHEEGVTCVEGRALWYAYARRDAFDWIMVVDDDVYVHRNNVEMTAAALPPLEPLVYTVGGCSKAQCAADAGGGICGGGGYLMSKHNLVKTMCAVPSVGGKAPFCSDGGAVKPMDARNTPSGLRAPSTQTHLKLWMREWMAVGELVKQQDGNWWSDITAGCVFHKLGGLSPKNLEGLHPWVLKASDLVSRLAEDAPLSFHYVGREGMPGMRGMHKLVAGTHRGSTANVHRVAEVVNRLHPPSSPPSSPPLVVAGKV